MDKTQKTKTCSKCGISKDHSLFSSYIVKGVRGLRGECKDCSRVYFRDKARERYKNNPESCRKLSREYAARNPEKTRERYKKWASTDKAKELKREREKGYYNSNPTKAQEKRRKLSRKDREILGDSYIAFRLGGNIKNIPKDLIEAKRIQLQIKRYLKNGN